jgi:hypothetical protein
MLSQKFLLTLPKKYFRPKKGEWAKIPDNEIF